MNLRVVDPDGRDAVPEAVAHQREMGRRIGELLERDAGGERV